MDQGGQMSLAAWMLLLDPYSPAFEIALPPDRFSLQRFFDHGNGKLLHTLLNNRMFQSSTGSNERVTYALLGRHLVETFPHVDTMWTLLFVPFDASPCI